MDMPPHTLLKTVNYTSSPTRWGRIVSECKMKEPQINTAASIGALLFGAVSSAAAVAMWLSAGQINAHDMQALGSRMSGIEQQVSKLTDAVNAGPRADQIQDIIRHLSAQDGRLDAMDGRTRVLESGVAGLTARLDGYDAASRAELSKRRP